MLKAGQIVKSIAGHDSGKFYMIVEVEKNRVTIADGKARKLIKPKAKNPAHLRPTNTVLDPAAAETDRKLRKALAEFRRATTLEGGC